MADLLPSDSGPPDDRDDRDPKVIGLDSDEADDLLGAISSSTARSVLASLHESPATPSDLATEVDTSLQNVQYHLGNLSEAGLIEVADTRYSEKGREMKVFAPADRALVVVAGREDDTTGLKGALSRLIGGVGVLGIGAAVVNRLARTGVVFPFGARTGGNADGGGGGGTAASLNETTAVAGDAGTAGGADATTAAPTATRTATETATTTDGGGVGIAEATTTPPPEATRTAAETATQTGGDATRTVTEMTRTAAETATAAPTGTPTPAATHTATAAPTHTPATTVQQATETAMHLTAGGGGGLDQAIASLSPGVLFFLGGLTVLLGWVALGLLRD